MKRKTLIPLLAMTLVSRVVFADGLTPIPLDQAIPKAAAQTSEPLELLPPANPVAEAPMSLEPASQAPGNSSDDIVVENSTILSDEVVPPAPAIESPETVIEDPVDPYYGIELPERVGLPCLRLRAPILLRPVESTVVVVHRVPALFRAPRTHLFVSPAVTQTVVVPEPVGPAVVEIDAAAVMVPGQPIRNRLRARRAGLFR